MQKQVHRKCPLCGSHFDNEKLRRTSFCLRIFYYRIVMKLCRVNIVDSYMPILTQCKGYDNYYARFSKYEDPEISSGGLANKWDKQKFEPIARCMSSFQSLESTILDVGCANGGLLATLKTMGYSKLTGLDPSPTCVSYVNNHHNIKVLQGWDIRFRP